MDVRVAIVYALIPFVAFIVIMGVFFFIVHRFRDRIRPGRQSSETQQD